MKVAIHQPNFLPWLGYFNKIKKVDVFVLLDDVQYVKGTIANRNLIKNKKGESQYVTVPVKISKGWDKKYNEIEIDYSQKWINKHLNLFYDAYHKAPYFDIMYEFIETRYNKKYPVLSELNNDFILSILSELNIETKIYINSQIEYNFGCKNDQNVGISKYFNADIYLSGMGAKKYNDESLYTENGIKLEYQNFQYPIYPQLYGEFVPNLSIVDALFNCGWEGTKKLL